MNRRTEGIFAISWSPRGRVPKAAFSAARPLLERASGLKGLDRAYRARPGGLSGEQFLSWALDHFAIRTTVTDADLARVPKEGPVVVVANHPYGGIEGIALTRAVRRVRPDVKLLANALVGRIPELRELLVLVDPFDRPGSTGANAAGMRQARAWLAAGGVLVVFPAGEVSSLDLGRRRVADPVWSPAVARLARSTGATAVPVFIPGRNGALFQTAGLIHPALRTALLPRELLARTGGAIELRVGTPVSPARLRGFANDAKAISYLRDRTEILAERAATSAVPGTAVQPRRTPPASAPIAEPVDAGRLAEEIAALSEESLLLDGEGLEVRVARAGSIPSVLREIGRLRETTFRDVGEGTGRALDLDAFDATYRHLFLWSRASREIVGAYRLGATDELIAASGVRGLYTASLFDYDPRLFEAMGPALEMGRSWIRTEHQKSYAGLMLLWKGIAAFVVRHPRYATLFGPVSISAEYRSLSQQLIVAFLERNRTSSDWARWVRPTHPFREPKRHGLRPQPSHLEDLDEVSTFISEIEADQKGVPVLLKQYLKLDGRLLGYNVDPDFSNVLDVLIAVDLRRTESKILGRYMGREGAAGFRAFHLATGRTRAS